SSEGRVPDRLFAPSCTLITVVSASSQLTPYHWHSVPAAPFQPLFVVQFAPPVAVNSVSSAPRSDEGIAAPAGAQQTADARAITPQANVRGDMHPSRSRVGVF